MFDGIGGWDLRKQDLARPEELKHESVGEPQHMMQVFFSFSRGIRERDGETDRQTDRCTQRLSKKIINL
jgi:hypothetical protein